MSVASMTGFARCEGGADDVSFVWELRSVNGKGLDLKIRLPQGFEAIESEVRRLAAARLTRGNVQISLQVRRGEERPDFSLNEAMLEQMLALTRRLVDGGHAAPPTADGLLAIRGVIDVADSSVGAEALAERHELALARFGEALERLCEARREEGAALKAILDQRIAELHDLVMRAEADPARRPQTIRARLAAQVAEILQAAEGLDDQRLHAEVALLATRADIREELDRLRTHLDAAAALLSSGGPIGRRLDFLSQEFNRESNTICSKSNAASLTAIGVEMKVVVDQFREQVQNLE
ncbi:YicC/YloC family endoribonuclease [Mangrovibrevibacter kandeliae]|uniref:YicC/YloC family endoribonuclease n=1 Tax=Mangrovibrevibacter kandeliae TaxID=2968473 RepID=UPI0021193754|nr:YicC/YloC family endoribonuclease [Aurantimonas sp. CSK15Z-1]MCQ8781377.1 YicC family protein [Aurantimonas sp. CSK15Z-1]